MQVARTPQRPKQHYTVWAKEQTCDRQVHGHPPKGGTAGQKVKWSQSEVRIEKVECPGCCRAGQVLGLAQDTCESCWAWTGCVRQQSKNIYNNTINKDRTSYQLIKQEVRTGVEEVYTNRALGTCLQGARTKWNHAQNCRISWSMLYGMNLNVSSSLYT